MWENHIALYNSIGACTSSWEHHDKWLILIRQTIWMRTDIEAHNMPSTEALRLHWTRTVWVLQMWQSSTENDFELSGMYNNTIFKFACIICTCTCTCTLYTYINIYCFVALDEYGPYSSSAIIQ